MRVYIFNFGDYTNINDKYAHFFLRLSRRSVQKYKDMPYV